MTLALAIALLSAPAQSAPYPVFENDKIPAAEFVARRTALKGALGEGVIGVFFTNPERHRNGDVDFQFRPDSDFWYLTGFEEPDSALIVVPDGVDLGGRRVTEVLFVNLPDQASLTWLGYRMGPTNAETLLRVEMARSNSEFAAVLKEVQQKSVASRLATNGVPGGASGTLGRMGAAFDSWASAMSRDNAWRPYLMRAREIKSEQEQRLILKAVTVSSQAHIEAMRAIRPGMREYEISALVQYVFAKQGCEYPGYPPIVGSGPNSTILHYNSNRRLMQDGDIVCMDTAGEYHGYTADVTRSFPVNGKFSPEQKAVYEVVLRASDAGIAACKPGATRQQIGAVISGELAKGLQALGIIQGAGELRQYYMHGWGHNIGLDVHDVQPRQTLEAGITLTVEPGVYIKEGSPCDKKWWNIGVRIEDNMLIAPGGPLNMSASCPRTVAEIEGLMAKGR